MADLSSVEEVARLYRVHGMTVRRHIKQGKLRAVKMGGRIRVRKEEGERFMESVEAPAHAAALPAVPPSAEEIKRRRALFARVMHLRAAIGLIGTTADALVREARMSEDASQG